MKCVIFIHSGFQHTSATCGIKEMKQKSLLTHFIFIVLNFCTKQVTIGGLLQDYLSEKARISDLKNQTTA